MRGFAIESLTEEGNWDMVGNTSPSFRVSSADVIGRDRESHQRDRCVVIARGDSPAAARAQGD